MKGYFGWQNDYFDREEEDLGPMEQPRCGCGAFLRIGCVNFCFVQEHSFGYDTYKDNGEWDKHLEQGKWQERFEATRCAKCGAVHHEYTVGLFRVDYPEPKVLQWVKVKEEMRHENGAYVSSASYEAREIPA